ncbi:MAG: formate dehydrogenase accessory sulfurtransferase FdhD [Candidatus Cloacimonadota bacterium]|nr:formate dehydrogenase accessory sulfurtransferase FdhD [Candidatus Cloacimonadota bacterium]
MDNLRKLLEIKKYSDKNVKSKTDIVIRETSLKLILNNQELLKLACLPENYIELALGFLFTEGLVKHKSEIEKIVQDINNKIVVVKANIPDKRIESFLQTSEKASGCGNSFSSFQLKQKFQTSLKIEVKRILILMHDFHNKAKLFLQTGGVHSAALCSWEKILFFADDIGRHNAIDKVVGMSIQENLDFKNKLIITTGRISAEIIRKAIRIQIGTIISHSAPTSKAVDLAWNSGINLIGFARNKRFNLYTNFND